jgi:hypothetical protein
MLRHHLLQGIYVAFNAIGSLNCNGSVQKAVLRVQILSVSADCSDQEEHNNSAAPIGPSRNQLALSDDFGSNIS